MTKHVLDRPRAAAVTRAQKYLEADRRDEVHAATRELFRRGRPDTGERVKRFVQIARIGDQET